TIRHWVAMLCPDPLIGSLYREFMAQSSAEIRLILAHGYAIYSNDLIFHQSRHKAVLLTPKAIGPKLHQNFQNTYPHPHSLIAAFHAPEEDQATLIEIARGLGFAKRSLVSATFEEETMGDLMSEQGLLCGGVFNLLEWTLESMQKAGIPEALIR